MTQTSPNCSTLNINITRYQKNYTESAPVHLVKF